MTFPDRMQELLQELAEEWNRAEEAIKQAEFIQGEVILPSINELRYAGRKVVEALEVAQNEPRRAERLLTDAIFDCMRARHDAVDAITAFISEKIDVLTEELGAAIVLQCFPDMPKLVAALGRVQDAIVVSRENRNDRDAIYETLRQSDLPAIINMYRDLQANEKIMQARALEEEVRAQEEKRKQRISLWLALLGLFVGVAGVIAAVFF